MAGCPAGAWAVRLHTAFSRYTLSGRRLTADSSLLRAHTGPVTVVKHTPSSLRDRCLPSGSLVLKAEFRRTARAPASPSFRACFPVIPGLLSCHSGLAPESLCRVFGLPCTKVRQTPDCNPASAAFLVTERRLCSRPIWVYDYGSRSYVPFQSEPRSVRGRRVH